MKANELMIGDWVMDGDMPTRVTSITCDGIVETMRRISNIEVVEPIPLTPEILEKNGFKYVKENQWVWEEKYHSNVDIIHIDDCISFCKEYPSEKNGGLQTGGWIQAISERGRVDIASEYVHELQQALRLCKIDKEITI